MRSLLYPAVLASLAACSSAKQNVQPTAETHEALPFIEDDYPRAVELARTKKLPIFVDVWAPW